MLEKSYGLIPGCSYQYLGIGNFRIFTYISTNLNMGYYDQGFRCMIPKTFNPCILRRTK